MSGRAASVEQPGCTQQEGTGTHAAESSDPLSCRADPLHRRAVSSDLAQAGFVSANQEHCIDIARELADRSRSGDLQARIRAHGAACARGDDDAVAASTGAAVTVGGVEYFQGTADIEGLTPVVGEQHDDPLALGGVVAFSGGRGGR